MSEVWKKRELDQKLYNEIRGFVITRLLPKYHSRHLDDCVQLCAFEWFLGRTNLNWSLSKYCYENGLNINGRSKVSAAPLEEAFRLTDKLDPAKENIQDFLDAAIENLKPDKVFDNPKMEMFESLNLLYEETDDYDFYKDPIEQFVWIDMDLKIDEYLKPLNLSPELTSWTKKHCRLKTKKKIKLVS